MDRTVNSKTAGNGLLVIEVSSPEELEAKLLRFSKEKTQPPSRYVHLVVNGQQVLSYPFYFENADFPEVEHRLMLEAVELLSMPAEEIELDFQVFNYTSSGIRGVYSCMPKKTLEDYFSLLYKAKKVPLRVTPRILLTFDSFFKQYSPKENSFCFFDFSKDNTIQLAAVNEGYCYLLREILYEDSEEAKQEIIQSLRCASSKSNAKQFERLYLSGALADKKDIVSQIAKEFGAPIESFKSPNILDSKNQEGFFFKLNLVRNYFFATEQRKKIFKVIDLAIVVCLGVSILLGATTIRSGMLIKRINSSFSASDYQYAKEIEIQLKKYEHKK